MKTIDFNEILRLIQTSQPVLCIDVREAYRQASMDAGGWKIPYNEIARHADLLLPFRDCLTVVCCLRPSGSQRTTIAAGALRKLGFSDVRELKNGLYQGWIQKVGRKAKLPVAAQRVPI
ncbi:MAG: rhodanese-like domain-containing protein [Saprospirales bacterium]|nr:rhodanese-like domain-containing protein [Saprospirales bacterium]